jgi:hypothetical protein
MYLIVPSPWEPNVIRMLSCVDSGRIKTSVPQLEVSIYSAGVKRTGLTSRCMTNSSCM